MKNLFTQLSLLFVLTVLYYGTVNAQMASSIPHTFAVASTPPAFPGGANWIVVASQIDDFDTLMVPAGFSFVFGGVTYTKVVISTNGWVALCPAGVGPTVPASLAGGLPNNALANNTSGYPIIAPLWDDLSTAVVTHGMVGSAYWIRWTVKWQKTNGAAANSLFYLKLDGSNNSISFYYSNNTTYAPVNASASIGIAGVCTGDFYSVSPTSPTTATIDSVTENTNVGAPRPYNVYYTFTPITSPANDACANATAMGTVNGTCTPVLATTYNAVTSGLPGNCGTSDVKDVWFSYIKPSGVASVQFTTSPGACGTVTGTSMEVYTTCGSAVVGCATTSTPNPNYAQLTVNRSPCVVETLLVRVTADNDAAGKFMICAKDVSTSNGQICATATPICFPLPVTVSGTTNGALDDYDDSTVCQSAWMTGQDYLYTFNPSVSGCFNFSLSGAGTNTYPGLHIFDGCPDDTAGTTCVASSQQQSNTADILNLTLQAGHTYYILIDNNATLAGSNWINYSLNIANSVTAAPPNDNCGSAAPLGNVPFNATCNWSAPYNLQCATPSPIAGYPNPVCGGFVPGLTNDVWFTFTPTFSGSIMINTQGTGANPAQHLGMAVYTGGCGLLSLVSCAGDSTGIVYLPSLSIAVTNQTYYLRVWSATYGDPGTFQICFQANCAPPNDLPVNATALPLATPMLGDNTCSTGAQEMPNPINCPTGVVNTVWYKIVMPASGQCAVRISQVSLPDASVAAFTFASGPGSAATIYNRLACNDDIIFAPPCPICGMSGDNDAAIQFTAPAGSTVYIAVDGEAGAVGSFWITAIDGTLSSTFPPTYRKDCANPEIICDNSNYVAPSGGIGSAGNICDFSNLACSGGASTSEVGSIWLQFTVSVGSPLGFTITPNDSAAPVANFNFYLWDVTNIPNICSVLGTTPPTRCNTVAGTGKTGCRAPASGQFATTITAQATPRTYLLNVQNLTSANDDEGAPGTQTGFVLDWTIYTGGVPSGTTVISGSSPICNWTGTVVNTDYQFLPNWKGIGTCPAVLPTCNTDVNVSAATQICVVSANSYAKTITINAGGTLRLDAGSTLHVCGDFINNGTFLAMPGSTVSFEGPTNQQIKGSVTGANAFANLTVNKVAGSGTVKLMTNVDITGNFLTSNATSIFDAAGKYMKVGGNFTNNNGNVTFIPTAAGLQSTTLEFYGTTPYQYFTNVTGSLTLPRVFMNKSTGNVYISGANSNMNIDTVLNMTLGNIVTSMANEVNIKLNNATALINYGVNSYIDGKLRRKLWLGSIDWPVGDSLVPNPGVSKGYELANITFTSSTVIPDLVAWFNIWPSAPPLGPATPDFCAVLPAANSYTTMYDQQIFDNGYWAFQRQVANFNGAYNVTLHNTGGTNTGGGVAWTVGYAPILSTPTLSASWGLQGVCVPTSTAAITKRNTFNTPALSTMSFNHYYATLQSITILPVELIYFEAELKGEEVLCTWETASETNNDHFEVERSTDGYEFKSIGSVRGYGPGTTSQKRSYSLPDHDKCEEIRYYRLKQIDIDGKYTYSKPVAINCAMSKDDVKVYPNPGQNNIISTFYQNQDGKVTIQWTDVLGKVVKEDTYDVIKGFNNVKTDITSLSNGVYYIRIKDSSSNEKQIKFLKN